MHAVPCYVLALATTQLVQSIVRTALINGALATLWVICEVS